MRVLFISSFLLFPGSRVGGAKRLHFLACELARTCELSVLCTDVSGEAEARKTPIEPPFPRFLQVRYRRHWLDKITSPLGLVRSLAPEAERIEAFVGSRPYDAVICAFPHSLSFLELGSLRSVRDVIYIEDDLALETAREKWRTARGLVERLFRFIRLRQNERFYRHHLRRVRCFVAISEEEERLVRRDHPGVETTIVGYGIPLERFPLLPPPMKPRVLGFIGHYSHQPNVDAMRYFLKEWFPLLRQRLPGVTMHIAGKEIPPSLREEYASETAIVWREDVPELQSFYEEISIFVNPIVSQRGLRTKVVEAAAFGRPVISTHLGAEGLSDLEIHLCDTATAAADACFSLEDGAEYRRVVDLNRELIEQHYSVEAVGRALRACLDASPSFEPAVHA